MTIRAYASLEQGRRLEAFEYEPGPLGADEVEIAVESCGICHSDLSMLENDWGMTGYPFVPGHEVSGTAAAVGANVTHVKEGQRVGLGWWARSCTSCDQCLAGDHNLCTTAAGTIVGRRGGFAEKVRAQGMWVFPLPEGVDPRTAGPLFCGGITVFNPIVQNGLDARHHVGVVGIGGLGHLALRFLAAFGCEVTAFSTSPSKEEEARRLGAHGFLNTRDGDAIAKAQGTFDLILVTVNVPLDWDAYIGMLKPRGTLHLVGAAPEVKSAVFPLILGQKSIKGTPVGSPGTIRQMLDVCGRHGITPVTEFFPFSKVNEAMEHLKEGKARYRIVLENDWS